jgi:hypothetical protein
LLEFDVAYQGLVQVLARSEPGGLQHLADAPIEALDHVVGLWVSGLDEAVLDAVGGADPTESMLTGRLTLSGGAEAV